MKAIITSTINANENQMWEELEKSASLIFVAAPILKFRPQEGQSIPEKWSCDTEYKFSLSLFGVIPIGNHLIRLVEIDKRRNRMVSNEYGSLTRVWNHIIRFDSIDDKTVRYTDEIEIKAGILTFPIWLFSLVFYRHRQRKWKKLFSQLTKE